jgi:hypothetical protein
VSRYTFGQQRGEIASFDLALAIRRGEERRRLAKARRQAREDRRVKRAGWWLRREVSADAPQ